MGAAAGGDGEADDPLIVGPTEPGRRLEHALPTRSGRVTNSRCGGHQRERATESVRVLPWRCGRAQEPVSVVVTAHFRCGPSGLLSEVPHGRNRSCPHDEASRPSS